MNHNCFDLRSIVHKKLIDHAGIPSSLEIELHPIHDITLNGKKYHHFVINCQGSELKFLLKVSKSGDNTVFCNKFLRAICDRNGANLYPLIIVPEFNVQGISYYITSFIEGQTLNQLPDMSPDYIWDKVTQGLRLRLDELSEIRAPWYSEQGSFICDDCATILKEKFERRIHHPIMSSFSRKRIDRALLRCSEILDTSKFSPPTLLHMDIKPENIVYNPSTGSVSLIDFEFARFGDIDYGWTQILLSGCNGFGKAYEEKILSRLTEKRINLKDALEIPKFQCYLLYQTMCNLSYYYDHSLRCPTAMYNLFDTIIDRI